MTVLGIDPGPEKSAYAIVDDDPFVVTAATVENELLLRMMNHVFQLNCVCERIRSYGMPAGAELFETAEWCGRYQQTWLHEHDGRQWHWMERRTVKLHLCGQSRAKDANIRQAIIDRFGGRVAIGAKKQPGPLYGISGDQWAALAVALTWLDQQK